MRCTIDRKWLKTLFVFHDVSNQELKRFQCPIVLHNDRTFHPRSSKFESFFGEIWISNYTVSIHLLFYLFFKQAEMQFDSAQMLCNQEIASGCHALVFNDSESHSCLNASFKLKTDLISVRYAISLKLKAVKATSYEPPIWSSNVDVCNLQKGVVGSFLAQILTQELPKYSNYSMECPQKAGEYYVDSFPLDVIANNFPRSILRAFIKDKPMWELEGVWKAKQSKTKPMILFSKCSLHGRMIFWDDVVLYDNNK